MCEDGAEEDQWSQQGGSLPGRGNRFNDPVGPPVVMHMAETVRKYNQQAEDWQQKDHPVMAGPEFGHVLHRIVEKGADRCV